MDTVPTLQQTECMLVLCSKTLNNWLTPFVRFTCYSRLLVGRTFTMFYTTVIYQKLISLRTVATAVVAPSDLQEQKKTRGNKVQTTYKKRCNLYLVELLWEEKKVFSVDVGSTAYLITYLHFEIKLADSGMTAASYRM